MKKVIYLNTIYFLLMGILFSCKQNNTVEEKNSQLITESVKNTVNQPEENQEEGNIKDFQGIWESFSYYLEHESEFKDFNKNKYYKVINGKRTLDIILINHKEDSININLGYLGFLNSFEPHSISSEEKLKNSLNDSGSLLVRYINTSKKYTTDDVEVSTNFSRYFEITELFDDNFHYQGEPEKFSFMVDFALPESVFKTLKSLAIVNKFDYIEQFNIRNLSKKIKVKESKTFFYSEMFEATKRKAFLVKGDIAYLESISDNWVKVYYDGKMVTGGYLKRSDVEFL